MMEKQLDLFNDVMHTRKMHLRTSDGKFATKREADLEKREKRIAFLEQQHIIDQRKIEALTQLTHLTR